MAGGTTSLDAPASIIFVGNSYTFGRIDPIMHYNADRVRDLTAPVPGTTFANTTGTNPYEPHPWGGVPGVFKAFADEAGLTLDVAISARNAATLQGHYLNSNPGRWDLRGNIASQAWDTVVLQGNSTEALHDGAGSITFAPGSSTATLTLTPIADTRVETDEAVGLTLAAGTGYRVSTTSTLSGTILNDDPTGPTINPAAPTVTLAANPAAALEDSGGRLVYTFTRTGSTTAPLTIDFGVARDGSTAPSVAAGGDFQTQGSSIYRFESGGAATAGSVSFTNNTGSVTIAAGATTATLTLLPRADTTVEADESIRFTLGANAAYNVGTPGPVAVTIVNDDFAPGTDTSLPSITVSQPASAVYEDGAGSLVWQFNRTGSTASALTVNFGVNGAATLPGGDFTVGGATTFQTAGAANPDLAGFQTYATKLAEYAKAGAADGAVPANPHANPAADVYLYETWARPSLVTGARVATTDDQTGAITTTGTTAPEYYASLEDMTADLRAAYEGLAAANPIFRGVAPVGAAFLAAVQAGTAVRDTYANPAGADGAINLWWDDNLHASKYGSYLSTLTLFGTITGVDPRALGAGDRAAADLGIDPAVAAALQNIAAATVGFSLQAHWTAPGVVTELPGVGAGLLATAGAFSFADTDTTAVHTVGVAAVTPGALGTLTAALHSDTTGDGTGGAVNWTYAVDDAAVAYLGAGQTRVEQFRVSVTDRNGGTVERTIAVTINGTNDAPVVTGAVTGTAAEGGARVTLDALATASDADQGTVLSVVNLPATLPAGVTYDALTHSFTLDPSNAAYQALPADQKRAVTVQYAVSDGLADPVAGSVTFAVALDRTPPAAPTVALSHDTGSSTADHITSDAGLAVSPAETGGRLSYSVDQAAAAAGYVAPTADGAHTVAVTQTDAAGNVSAPGSVSFVLDRTAPALQADAASGTGVAAALSGHVLANDTDASALHVAAVQFASSLSHVVPASGTAQVDSSNGTLRIAADGSYSFQPTVAGHTVFTETVVDAAGNASQTTLSVDVAAAPIPASLSFGFALTDAHFDFSHGRDLMTAPDGTVTDLTGVGTIAFTDGTIQETDKAPLVDNLYYDATNLDVWRAHADPDQHYAVYGWHEGRDPNAYFSTRAYLANNPDVAAANIDPLTHYDQYGWHEGRSPGTNFSAEAYLAVNADVARAGLDPLTHYLAYGQSEGRFAFPGLTTAEGSGDHLYGAFDATYYLAHNSDVAAAARMQAGSADSFAFQHYLAHGAQEGRDPNAYLSSRSYLGTNPDVAAAGANPLLHYEQYGWHEGRDPSAAFHTDAYLAVNPDVAAAQIDPLQHYLQFGSAEGRHIA